MDVPRPVLRYHGGKWNLAKWIISHFPKHRIYTEVFGGGASVLMQKPRSYAEVYNERDAEIVNVFAVLRVPELAIQLEKQLRLTPFARQEFLDSYNMCYLCVKAPILCVECARCTIIKSFMGFGSNSIQRLSGFRADNNRAGTTPAHDWKNYADAIPTFCDRLQGIVIERRDALVVLKKHDREDALHYVDPPYLPDTRNPGQDYRFELTADQHSGLAQLLRTLKGMVVLSGYNSELYCNLYRDWTRIDRPALADGARPRIESVWLNPAAANKQNNLLALS